jgi:hypothetical protein
MALVLRNRSRLRATPSVFFDTLDDAFDDAFDPGALDILALILYPA